MKYIEWNYDEMLAIEYERHGECNQCGECCKAKITFKGKRCGGDGTDEIGAWSEINDENENRLFFKPFKFELDEYTCPKYKNYKCSIYDNREEICITWPLSPRDVIMMPSCSYWFDEIDQWKIE